MILRLTHVIGYKLGPFSSLLSKNQSKYVTYYILYILFLFYEYCVSIEIVILVIHKLLYNFI